MATIQNSSSQGKPSIPQGDAASETVGVIERQIRSLLVSLVGKYGADWFWRLGEERRKIMDFYYKRLMQIVRSGEPVKPEKGETE